MAHVQGHVGCSEKSNAAVKIWEIVMVGDSGGKEEGQGMLKFRMSNKHDWVHDRMY